MNIFELELPKTEAEAWDHKKTCGGLRCPVCYYAENLLIHTSIENIIADEN